MKFQPWQLLLLESYRPRQWPKNPLVFAAPLRAGGALVAFCLVSSAIYLLNDCLDVAADQAQPSKRYRPIAAVPECSPFT
jgi:decaprenyl-phosphate phosphoribosyltransferase